MKRTPRDTEPGALDLIEEGIHLLRRAGAAAMLVELLALLPFVVAFLFFWADMAQSPFARERCAPQALLLAVLFIAKRTGQRAFCSRLLAVASRGPQDRWSLRRFLREAGTQAVFAPAGLWALPLSAVALFPFAWCWAWYQNLAAMPVPDGSGLRATCRSAARLAAPWPRQNHILISAIFLFAAFVFVNVFILLAMTPYLVKTFFGIDSRFTQSYVWIGSTTFMLIAMAATYLCVDPLIKAVYVLRCYYAESRRNGRDILNDLRGLATVRALVLASALLGTAPSSADEPPPDVTPEVRVESSAAPAIREADLNESIDSVMMRKEFSWRLPRDLFGDEGRDTKSWFERSVEDLVTWTGRQIKKLARGIERVLEWIGDLLRFQRAERPVNESSHDSRWMDAIGWLTWVLLALLAAILAILILRTWKIRRGPVAEATPVTPPQVSDLEDESVMATQQPEEEWLKLAESLAASGDHRLALRAFFLAMLAFLARMELLDVQRFKSNHDYRVDLDRRGRRFPLIHPLFAANVAALERVWYGRHPATDGDVALFRANIEKVRAHVAP